MVRIPGSNGFPCVVAPWLFVAMSACGVASQASASQPGYAAAASSGGVATASLESMPSSAPTSPMGSIASASIEPVPASPRAGIARATPARDTPVVPGAHVEVAAHAVPTSSSNAPAPMLVYTATLGLAVDTVSASIERTIHTATDAGGYLASQSDSTVQVRVPTVHFRDVMHALEALGDVTHHDVQAEDVSEQFHDLEVQLANLRAVRARLQEFLARAANVRDALEVEHELERVGAQIDQAEGRIAFLSNRAAYSTITVSLILRSHAIALPEPPPAQPPGVTLPFAWMQSLDLRNLLRLQ